MLCLTSSCRSTWAPLERSNCTTSVYPLPLTHMRAVLPNWGTEWDKTVTITCDEHGTRKQWKVYTWCKVLIIWGQWYQYCIVGYFHGVLISMIFVVHPMSQNFPPTKFFAQCINTVYTCSNLDRQHFVMAHFSYLHSIDSVLDTQGSFLKLFRVWWVMRKWTEQCRKQKHDQQKTGPVTITRQMQKSL